MRGMYSRCLFCGLGAEFGEGDHKPYEKFVFAGPKRGRPIWGFSIPVQVITTLSYFNSRSKFCPGYNGLILSPICSVVSYSAPNFFTDSGLPIKWLLLIRVANQRGPQPPLWRGPKYMLWGYCWWTILTTIESNIFLKLLTSNFTWAIFGESPDPPPPPDPPRSL